MKFDSYNDTRVFARCSCGTMSLHRKENLGIIEGGWLRLYEPYKCANCGKIQPVIDGFDPMKHVSLAKGDDNNTEQHTKTMVCSNCANKYNNTDTFCSVCGVKLDKQTQQEGESFNEIKHGIKPYDKNQKEEFAKREKIERAKDQGTLSPVSYLLIAAIIMATVFYIAYSILNASSCSKVSIDPCTDTLRAYVMSQQFVEKRLRSPSTAKFLSYNHEDVKVAPVSNSNCEFKIIGYVDAQNAFGATIRTKYYVHLKYSKSDKTWQALEIHIFK